MIITTKNGIISSEDNCMAVLLEKSDFEEGSLFSRMIEAKVELEQDGKVTKNLVACIPSAKTGPSGRLSEEELYKLLASDVDLVKEMSMCTELMDAFCRVQLQRHNPSNLAEPEEKNE